MNKQYGWILVGVLALMSGTLQAENKPAASQQDRLDGKPITLARYAKALVGQGNVTVEIAPYKTDEGREGAILLFKGIEGPWDGKAIHYSIRPTNFGVDYVTQEEGRERTTLTKRKREGVTTYTLYLPGADDGIDMVPSDGAAQMTTPRQILETYLEQQKNSSSGAKP